VLDVDAQRQVLGLTPSAFHDDRGPGPSGWLRIDPTFDPLLNNPRFRKLVEGTA
jgi:hypothetical protein